MTAPDAFRIAVLTALGSAPDEIEPGKLHRFSVNGKRSDTAGWCQLFADGRAGVFGDFRSGMSSVWTASGLVSRGDRAELARRVAQASKKRRDAQDAKSAAQAPRLARLWAACREVRADGSGADPVTLYLRRRLALAPDEPLTVPTAIRLHQALPYHHDGERVGTWPAMVAALTDPGGDRVTLHRTWLTDDGRKAPVPGPVKKLTASVGPIMGGCIRLVSADEWAGELLGVAEGIETAMAARCASGVPTVAAYSAGALAAWQWPHTLRRLVVFADADDTGVEAARSLAHRARMAGLSLKVLAPSTPGADWCDVWACRGAVGVAA